MCKVTNTWKWKLMTSLPLQVLNIGWFLSMFFFAFIKGKMVQCKEFSYWIFYLLKAQIEPSSKFDLGY